MSSAANQSTKLIINGSEDDDQACLHAMQYTNSCMLTLVINAAIELDIFGIIARAGPGAQISSFEIASQLPATKDPDFPSKLDRMLRLFVAHSFLKCSLCILEDGNKVERIYGLAPASKFLLGNEDEGSVASLLALNSYRATVETWLGMKDAIIEGGDQFKKVNGKSLFQFMNTDPSFNKIFNKAMAGISTLTMRKILETYKGFEGLTSLVDVGGGTGRALNIIISDYPSIKGINYDLPHVVQSAPSYPGIEHVGGDMFSSVPKGDAIVIKDTLHNWSDELCLKLLKNCYEVLPDNGKVIVITMLITEVPDSSMSSRYVAGVDYIMLMQVAGKERTLKEFEALCRGSGFSKFEVACSAYDIWGVIEFYK